MPFLGIGSSQSIYIVLTSIRDPMIKPAMRTDIQLLRGLAVTVVLLFHAKIPGFSFGFLGVDMFFVISGYLITRIIIREVDSGHFSFRGFYLRRAKRLLPAAYVTLGASACAAPIVLDAHELVDFGEQLIGAVLFVANVVLWRQSGYFEGAAELKPLLHLWSLSLEEQFYFVLPAALIVFGTRRRRQAVLIAAVVSFAAFAVSSSRSGAFFLLPTRGWQLLLGSLGALVPALSDRARAILHAAFWPSLVVLLTISTIGSPDRFEHGLNNLLASVATLVVILRRYHLQSSARQTQRVIVVFRWLGDRSYSLYLVHWPLFAFLNNMWLGPTDSLAPVEIRLAVLTLSLVLGALLHRYVERPAYTVAAGRERLMLAPLGAMSVVLVVIGLAPRELNSTSDNQEESRRVNYGLSAACEFRTKFSPTAACRTSSAPEVLVWGDSYAMHLVPALLASPQPPRLVQATRSVCGPIMGMAYVDIHGWYDMTWARSCIDFNSSVLEFLERTPSVTLVILASSLDQYVSPQKSVLLRDLISGSERIRPANLEVAAAAITMTVHEIQKRGRRAVIVGPPPFAGFDVGRCMQRSAQQLLILGAPRDCAVRLEQYRRARPFVLELVRILSTTENIELFDLTKLLCNNDGCMTRVKGKPLYRDEGHLSIAGARALGWTMHITPRIRESKLSLERHGARSSNLVSH